MSNITLYTSLFCICFLSVCCTSKLGNTETPEIDLTELRDELALKLDRQKHAVVYKSLRIEDTVKAIKMAIDSAFFEREWAFLDTKFNVQDPKLEGLWNKNTIIRERNEVELEYLSSDSKNPFRFIRVIKRNNTIERVISEREEFSWLGSRVYSIDWQINKKLSYGIQLEKGEKIRYSFTY